MTDVNTVNNDKPYALDVKDGLHGANGMTFAKSIGERIDDSYDAGSNPRYKVVNDGDDQYLLHWNTGENLPQLAKLLGLSNTISKKAENKIGLKNKGTFAGVCNLGPDELYCISRNNEGKPNELSFKFGDFVSTIEKCHDNYRDPKLITSNFIESSNRISVDTSDLMKKLASMIKDEKLKKEVSSTITSPGPSSLMICMRFKKTHRLFNKLDYEMDQCFSSFNLYHGLLLKSGRGNIVYEDAKGNKKELTKDTAIDLMWGYSYILGNVTVGIKDDEVVLKVDLSISDKPQEGTTTFYISNKPTDGRYKFSQVFASYPKWSKLTNKGTFKIRFTSLSPNDDKLMKARLGEDFTSVNDLRGVFVNWNGRYLGLPYWNTKKNSIWGSKQNCTPLRCDILIENSHFIAENICKIQSDKSQIDLDDAHPVLMELMNCFVGNIVNKMIQSTKKTAAQKADEDYKPVWTNQVFHLIQHGELPVPIPRPRPAVPAPAPVPVPVAPPVAPAPVAAAPVAPAPVAPAPVAPAHVAPAPVAPVPVAPAPLVPVAPAHVAPAPVTPVSVTPAPAQALPLTPVSRMTVHESTRAVPQSERDVLLKVQSFVTLWTPTVIAEKMTLAKTSTAPGYAEMMDNLVRMSELLQKIGTTH